MAVGSGGESWAAWSRSVTLEVLQPARAAAGWPPQARMRGAARAMARGGGGETELFFDLASVTKPMTAVAVACAGIDLRTPLGALVAEAKGTSAADVPLELFLAHRAGLPAHLPLHAPLLRGGSVDASAALRQVAEARRSDARGDPPAEGFAPLYSDLGYILAGEALARATGARDAGGRDRLAPPPPAGRRRIEPAPSASSRRAGSTALSRRRRTSPGGAASCAARSTTRTRGR